MADITSDKLRKKIKEILKDADLTTLSAKKVRMKLQSSFSTDLANRKKEIDKMTMTLIMEMEEKNKKAEGEKEEEEEEAGEEEEQQQEPKEEEEEQAENGDQNKSDEEEEEEPPKKKSKTKEKSKEKPKEKSKEKKPSSRKSKKMKELDDLDPLDNDVLQIYDEEQKTLKMSDEELARSLQSFEETGRRTRNRAAPRKKPGEKKERKAGTSTYSKPCALSADLAELMGQEKMARNEVVKKMWQIVKERKLEDPNDRRFMLCDEQLQKIFGRKRLQTFGMMKYLSSHIRDEGQSLETVITNSDIYDDEADDD